jgi:hypothetical protein
VKVNSRIYYCCDIHGSNVCFKKELNVAKYNVYNANVVIIGGERGSSQSPDSPTWIILQGHDLPPR